MIYTVCEYVIAVTGNITILDEQNAEPGILVFSSPVLIH